MKPKDPNHRSTKRGISSRQARSLSLAAMALVLAVLCAPRLNLGYFWDDYIFLTSGRADPLSFLLPHPALTIFYRPISMGLYFLALVALGPAGATLGHLLNLALLAGCVLLLSSLVSSIAGRRAGLYAGFAFAALGALPALVAWITAAQDILAILFLLVAFHLRDRGKTAATVVAAACALLCKETALALFPALILWPWILGRKPRRLLAPGLLLGGVTALWAAIHPAFRAYAAHGIRSEAIGYVHLQSPEHGALWIGRYLLLLLHLPVPGFPTIWPGDLTGYAAASVVILLVALEILVPKLPPERPPGPVAFSRIAALAALLVLPPLVLDTLMVGHWAPYYVCLPGMGGALLMGALLSKVPRGIAALCLALFLLLGVRCRGIDAPDALAFTESNMVRGSRAIHTLEARFKRLRPSFPKGSELLISVGASGTLGIDQTIRRGQAPRVWYQDPTLDARSPEERLRTGPLLLFRTTTDLTVAEILPEKEDYHWEGVVEPDVEEIVAPIYSLVRGTAACGDVEGALRILKMLRSLPGTEGHYEDRIQAMVLLGNGRKEEAARILATVPPYPRQLTLRMVIKLMDQPTRRERMDSSILPAFGLSEDNAQDVRDVMRQARADEKPWRAVDFATRLQRLLPGDAESAEVLRLAGR